MLRMAREMTADQICRECTRHWAVACEQTPERECSFQPPNDRGQEQVLTVVTLKCVCKIRPVDVVVYRAPRFGCASVMTMNDVCFFLYLDLARFRPFGSAEIVGWWMLGAHSPFAYNLKGG